MVLPLADSACSPVALQKSPAGCRKARGTGKVCQSKDPALSKRFGRLYNRATALLHQRVKGPDGWSTISSNPSAMREQPGDAGMALPADGCGAAPEPVPRVPSDRQSSSTRSSGLVVCVLNLQHMPHEDPVVSRCPQPKYCEIRQNRRCRCDHQTACPVEYERDGRGNTAGRTEASTADARGSSGIDIARSLTMTQATCILGRKIGGIWRVKMKKTE